MKVGDYVIGIPCFATNAGEIKGKITEISHPPKPEFALYRVVSGEHTLWCGKVRLVKRELLRRYFK
jgi:hypothetical protein